eukprot:TRINITY_DN5823_c0_g1_i1.p2 TRINITY_DN5823_c0_g1~~TRINITY_DN5823_c0_g1_i1.p2  ORF type:complete len:112 (-),score=26.03 TRINITY_DN5823_c0_g1_i1:63-398(-)
MVFIFSLLFFFFFKQKTAYEISACLVGSEMCIRDSLYPAHQSHDTYIKFETEFKSEQLMRFVEENSDGRIALPELPHVPEELLDEYLSMSAQASEETPFDEDRFLLIRDEL